MIFIILLAGAAVLLPVLIAKYLEVRTRKIIAAGPVWDRLNANVQRLVEDDDVPDIIVRFAYSAAMLTGCGCFARIFVLDLLPWNAFRRPEPDRSSDFAQAVENLSDEHRKLFSHVLADTLLFDALHLPFFGTLVSRGLWWVNATAERPDDSMSPAQIETVAVAVKQAEDRKQSHFHKLECVAA